MNGGREIPDGLVKFLGEEVGCTFLVDARDSAGLVARISYSWTALGHPPRYEQIVALGQMVQMFFDLAGEREAFG